MFSCRFFLIFFFKMSIGKPFRLWRGDGGGVFAGGASKHRLVATIVKSKPQATLVALPIGYLKSEDTKPGNGSPSGSFKRLGGLS